MVGPSSDYVSALVRTWIYPATSDDILRTLASSSRLTRVFSFGPGGGTGEVDGIVRDEFAVEIAAGSPKQVRASVIDLAFHPIRQKLLLVVPTSRQSIAKMRQPALILHRPGCSGIVFGVVGETDDELYEGDNERLAEVVQRWRSSVTQPQEVWAAGHTSVWKFGEKL